MQHFFTENNSYIHFFQPLPSQLTLKIILNKFFVNHPIYPTFLPLLPNINIDSNTISQLIDSPISSLSIDSISSFTDEQTTFINAISCTKVKRTTTSSQFCSQLNLKSIRIFDRNYLICSCFTCKYKWIICSKCFEVIRLRKQTHDPQHIQHQCTSTFTYTVIHESMNSIHDIHSSFDIDDFDVLESNHHLPNVTHQSQDIYYNIGQHYNSNNILTPYIFTKFSLEIITKYINLYSSNLLLNHLIIQASYQRDDIPVQTLNPIEKQLFIDLVFEIIQLPKGYKRNLGNIISLIKTNYDETILSLQHTNSAYNNIISSLLNNIDPLQRDLINTNIIQPILDTIPHQNTYNITINIPTNDNLIRKTIIEGKYSFLSNLPSANVETITITGYAYISIIQLLFINLHLGLQYKKNIIISDQKQILPLLIWSDSFIVGNPLNKGARSSVKVLNCAIVSNNKKKSSTKYKNVFSISLGKKNDKHYVSFAKIFQELILLKENGLKIFSPFNDTMIYPETTVYVVDRVEHNEVTGFSGHSSIFGKLPSISCPIQLHSFLNPTISQSNRMLYKDLMSCVSCESLRIINCNKMTYNCIYSENNIINPRRRNLIDNYKECLLKDTESFMTCEHCYDFNVLLCEFKPDSNYPFEDLLEYDSFRKTHNGIQRLLSKQITFETMKKACWTIYYHCSNFDTNVYTTWTKSKAKAFSQVECISTTLFEKIWKLSKRHKSKRNDGIDIGEPSDKKLFQKYPLLYNSSKFLPIDDIHIGIMHSIFENATKHIFEMLWDVTKSYTNIPYFFQECNELLENVKQLTLTHCKVYPLSTKEEPQAKWLAENYVGLVHILDAIAWRMHPFLDSDEFRYILIFIIMFQIFVAKIMDSKDTSDIIEIHTCAKLCLSSLYKVEQITFSNISHKPSRIESTSSFVYFLTIASSKSQYGNLRKLWEGGDFGEGSIKYLKKNIRRGVEHRGTLKSTLNKLQYENTLHLLNTNDQSNKKTRHEGNESRHEGNESCYSDGEEEADNTNTFFRNYDKYRKIFCYKSIRMCRKHLSEEKALNFIWNKIDKSLLIVFWGEKRKRLYSAVNILAQNNNEEPTADFNYDRYLIRGSNITLDEKQRVFDFDLSDDILKSTLCYPITKINGVIYYKITNLENRLVYNIINKEFENQVYPFTSEDVKKAIININTDIYS